MEVRVALDTNRLTDLFQGDHEPAEWLGTCDEVWIPLVVLGEIKAGLYAVRSNAGTSSSCKGCLQRQR